MHWKAQLHKLENEEAFDIGIFFMQMVIEKNTHDMDAYIALIYLLADIIMEPHSWDCAPEDDATRLYYRAKRGEYSRLGEQYQTESYSKFSNSPEYLFVCAYALVVDPWPSCGGYELRNVMWRKAYELEPNNPMYQGIYYRDVHEKVPSNPELIAWAQLMVGLNSPLNRFDNKGRAWEYAQWMARCFPTQVLEEQNLL